MCERVVCLLWDGLPSSVFQTLQAHRNPRNLRSINGADMCHAVHILLSFQSVLFVLVQKVCDLGLSFVFQADAPK